MTPLEKYQANLLCDDFSSDPAQKEAVQYTQALYEELIAIDEEKGLVEQIKNKLLNEKRQTTKGLYFWGGVGRGKHILLMHFTIAYLSLIKCGFTFIDSCKESTMS